MNKLTEALFNHQLPADLAASQRLNRQLLDLVTQLEQRVAELEDTAGSGSSSRNSSKPPSQDSPEQRAKRERKPKSARKPGAQPGHQGHQRVRVELSATDEQVHYYPDTRCTCGAVCDVAQEPYQRHQVFDLPEVRSQITEYCLYEAICPGCRQRRVARLPDSVPQGQMGPGLISWITLMNGAYALSVSNIQRLLKDHWQLAFSTGAVSQATCSVTEWLLPLYQQIGQAVRHLPVAHADETSHYRNGERRWLWVLCSSQVVYFLTHHSRGKGAANGLLDNFEGILVTDQHGGYNDYPVEKRQLCWAHIIRKFRKMSERVGRAGVLGKQLWRLSRLIIHCRNRWRSGGYSDAGYHARMQRFKQGMHTLLCLGLEIGPADPTQKARKTANQCRRLLTDESMLWTFLQDRAIPTTNNEAERAIRPYVIWRKTSFFSQSARGDQFRPVILTLTETCKRLGLGVYGILRKVCEQGLRGEAITVRLPLGQHAISA